MDAPFNVCVKGQQGWAASQLILTASLSDVSRLFIHYSGTSLCPTRLSSETLLFALSALASFQSICTENIYHTWSTYAYTHKTSWDYIQLIMHNDYFFAKVEGFLLSHTHQLSSNIHIYAFSSFTHWCVSLNAQYLIWNFALIIFKNKTWVWRKSWSH